MKKVCLYILAIVVLYGCTTEIDFGDLVTINQSRDNIIADGTDKVTFDLKFNRDSNSELIKAKATVNNALFVDNGETEIEITPVESIAGDLEARVEIRSTTVADTVIVKFNINEYKTEVNLSPIISEAVNIDLKASAFNVSNNFSSEVTLTGSLTNEMANKASNGFKVRFEDTFLDGSPVGGAYRAAALSSSNGQVSVIYSPGPVSANQYINIKTILLDDTGADTEIKDTVQLYITNE